MNNISHSTMVRQLTKPSSDICIEITPHKAEVLHHGLGILTEAGEIGDTVKKHVIYNQPLDLANLIEELGDIEFYLEGLRQAIGISRAQIIEENITKLGARYPGFRYSDISAKERKDKA